MAYVIGGRTIKEYLTMVKTPLLALIVLSVLGFLFGLLSYIPGVGGIFALLSIPVSLLIAVVSLVLACYIGYLAVKNYKGDLATAAAAGGVAGVILGLVSAVLGIVNSVFLLVVSPFIGVLGLVGSIIGIFLYPVIGAIVGAILAIIGGLVAGGSGFASASKK
jgi:hypothetical protein